VNLRTRTAVVLGRTVAALSRRSGRGAGEMIGGKVTLRLSPEALVHLAQGRRTGLVSGTNGKTTTTRLLAAALGPGTASNSGGANMAPGVLTALADQPSALAALEVDELHLPAVARAVQPSVIALLNLSRDQLDRASETRRISGLWRSLGPQLPSTTVVANADDPLVVWAALGFTRQVWVAAGQAWTADAMVCPRCAQLLRREARGSSTHWWCPSCGLQRPDTIEPDPVPLQLPGRCNQANAAMALAAAAVIGGDLSAARERMGQVSAVQGRYATVTLAGRPARLLLAKNPAGWVEMLELITDEDTTGSPSSTVVIHFHARVADGRDPSWIWDVPAAQLQGRAVLVSGERGADVLVRLRHAGVVATLHTGIADALRAAPDGPVDILATYTAFREVAVAAGVLQ
jgi:UDP-N-acetylmuramyl tripeptide synthase